jgi:hypothetical protein
MRDEEEPAPKEGVPATPSLEEPETAPDELEGYVPA